MELSNETKTYHDFSPAGAGGHLRSTKWQDRGNSISVLDNDHSTVLIDFFNVDDRVYYWLVWSRYMAKKKNDSVNRI